MIIDDYLNRITSQHNQRSKYIAFCTLFARWGVDRQNLIKAFISAYDLDLAIGNELDAIGDWVGVTRVVSPPVNGVSVLSDEDYRILLRAVIAINSWDGSITSAYRIWNTVFQLDGYKILIQDYSDMSILYVFFLPSNVSPVVIALIEGGHLGFKPASVRIKGYFQPSVPNAPVFGWGIQNDKIAGWGTGAWVKPISS